MCLFSFLFSHTVGVNDSQELIFHSCILDYEKISETKGMRKAHRKNASVANDVTEAKTKTKNRIFIYCILILTSQKSFVHQSHAKKTTRMLVDNIQTQIIIYGI